MTLIFCLVLHMVWEAHPTANRFETHRHRVVQPKAPATQQWITNCRHIGWATEYPECRIREA